MAIPTSLIKSVKSQLWISAAFVHLYWLNTNSLKLLDLISFSFSLNTSTALDVTCCSEWAKQLYNRQLLHEKKKFLLVFLCRELRSSDSNSRFLHKFFFNRAPHWCKTVSTVPRRTVFSKMLWGSLSRQWFADLICYTQRAGGITKLHATTCFWDKRRSRIEMTKNNLASELLCLHRI